MTVINGRFNWRVSALQILALTAAGLLFAAAVNLFFEPYAIAPSGVSGLALIVNSATGLPIGLLILLGNIPIQYLAYRMLGGWAVVARTVYLVAVYSLAIDLLAPLFPARGITDDRLLAALFGGILGGIAGGIAYRVGGTFGGTSTLARILQLRLGLPLNNTYLYTDTAVVVLAGLIFGWEGALYAMVAIFIDGAAADYVLDGPSTIRTATVITNRPDDVAQAVIKRLGRGVTMWQGTGMYTGQPRAVLFVTVLRPQVGELRQVVFATDHDAFIVIGQGHTAYGEGFTLVKGSRAAEAPPAARKDSA